MFVKLEIKQKEKKVMTIKQLTEKKFTNTAEIAQALQTFTCKVVPTTNRIYILEKGANRNKSHEFIVEEKGNYFIVKEI